MDIGSHEILELVSHNVNIPNCTKRGFSHHSVIHVFFLFAEQFHVIFYGNPVGTACHFGPNHFGPELRGSNYFYWGSSGLHSVAINLTLALVSKPRGLSASPTTNYCQRLLHSKGLRGSIKIKRNVRECHNQTKSQEV